MSDISAVNPFAPPVESTSPPPIENELGADVFLQLLVAQLKYQDPTSPADGTEFLAQTAQFTMVEKLSELAEQSQNNAVVNRNLGAASMVGQTISWLRVDGTSGEGVVERARLGTDGPVLVVNGEDVAFDHVSSVVATRPAPSAPASATPTAPAPTPSTDPDPADAPATPESPEPVAPTA